MTLLLQLRTVLWFAAIVVVAVSVGRRTACRLHWHAADRWSQLVWHAALGLVICGLLLAVLGIFGLLSASLVTGLTVLGVVVECVRLHLTRITAPSASAIVQRRDDPDVGEARPIPRLLTQLLCIGSSLAVVAALLGALAPPTAGDALCYHLELPKRYLQSGALTHFPFSDNSTYPLLTEMWFLWGLAVDGPIAAQLMHWLCGTLLAGACYVLALPLVGRSAAIVASCVVLLTPGINNQMTAPLNDVALALFTTLTIAAALQALRTRHACGFVVAGLMLGGALGVKYTALVFAAAAAISWAWAIWRLPQQRATLAWGGAILLLVAAATASPWYARAAWHRGDPLYPFLSSAPAAELPNAGPHAGPAKFPAVKTPLGRHPSALLVAPWQMTMQPERFGGRGHQLGPLFLMLLPALVLVPVAVRAHLKPLTAVALLYAGVCILLRQNVRFLFPLVPLFATATAAVLVAVPSWPRAPRLLAFASIGAVLLFLAAVPPARTRHHLAVAVGWEAREVYLARQEPTAAVASWANEHLPPGAHVLSQEQRAFYVDAPLTRENIFRRGAAYPRQLLDPGRSLSRVLRAQGFSHLLLAEGEGSNSGLYDATLSRAVDRELATSPDTAPAPLAEFHTATTDGVARRYRILALR